MGALLGESLGGGEVVAKDNIQPNMVAKGI